VSSRDTVAVRGIQGFGYHGVLPQERRDGQSFVVDVVVTLDTRPAAAGDDLGLTVDYADVARTANGVITGEPVDLVETVAAMIADAVLVNPRVEQVEVSVHKPQAPIGLPFDDVVVTITRLREPGV